MHDRIGYTLQEFAEIGWKVCKGHKLRNDDVYQYLVDLKRQHAKEKTTMRKLRNEAIRQDDRALREWALTGVQQRCKAQNVIKLVMQELETHISEQLRPCSAKSRMAS